MIDIHDNLKELKGNQTFTQDEQTEAQFMAWQATCHLAFTCGAMVDGNRKDAMQNFSIAASALMAVGATIDPKIKEQFELTLKTLAERADAQSHAE